MDASSRTELDEIRRQLLDPDAGRRFDAVDRIAKGRLKELGPDLVPVLEDEDLFVRILAMQVLGDFGYVEAVPALFGVLDDPNAPIRKQAAETLVRLTGYDPQYDHRGTKAEREKAVKRWKDWLAGR
jgi:HEAT repeat protein